MVKSAISRQVALELQEEVVYLEALRHHLQAVAYRLVVGAAFHHREVEVERRAAAASRHLEAVAYRLGVGAAFHHREVEALHHREVEV